MNGLISHNPTLLAKDYRQVHKHFQNPDLSVEDSELCGVYIIARPNRWQRSMTLPFKPCHWSHYSQGHYYHLAEGERTGKPAIILRDDKYSAPQALERNPPDDPFIAYHIGMTDYRSDQIHTLAKWAVTNLVKNDFSVTNYQHLSLHSGIAFCAAPVMERFSWALFYKLLSKSTTLTLSDQVFPSLVDIRLESGCQVRRSKSILPKRDSSSVLRLKQMPKDLLSVGKTGNGEGLI